jgi:hypothetical protein
VTSTSECSYEWGDYRGGRLRVIASIEEPAVIERILKHLGREAVPVDAAHPSRAPPRSDRLI